MGDTGVMNCYEVLGLMRGASVEDIKAAFRLRSHMFHPDKYENYAEPLRTQLMAEAGKEFKKLTAAYEILRDPARRTAHDRELSARDRQAGVASVRAAPARASTRRAASPATTADGEEAPRRTRRASAPEPPPAPPERDPQILVRPDRLDFGILTAGSTGRLALKVQNVGGRTLFGEVSSNRAWVTVNQRSFISSSVVVFVTADTSGLRAGQAYSAQIVVKTLNGGDEVVPVTLRVAATAEPQLAGAPSIIDFGETETGTRKVRTVSLTNSGSGTLIGTVATRTPWLALSEQQFRANTFSFEVIATTANLAPGEHSGQFQVFSNGGPATVTVVIQVPARDPGTGLASRTAASPAPPPPEDPEPASPSLETPGPALQRELLARILRIEPESDWERDLLMALTRMIQAGRPLAPGELAKIYELEARGADA